MINDIPLLSLLTFLPLLGAGLIMLVSAINREKLASGEDQSGDSFSKESSRVLKSGLLITVSTFVLAVFCFFLIDFNAPGYALVEEVRWFAKVQYKLGVDGLSMSLILLTTFLMPLCILASWNTIKQRITEYVVAFLILETFMIGVFVSLDLVLFYIFFEAGLIPMFFIIGIWGGNQSVLASFKFFLYTLAGSLFMLAAIVFIYLATGTSDIAELHNLRLGLPIQIWLWLAFAASFAIKLPMWPVHTWLPDAHVQAPTAGSVILAGVLLKMGGYGFLRFSLPMFPDASLFFQPYMFALAVVAIVYTSLVAYQQNDMKKMIAYSSVAHMGFVVLGIFSFNELGIQGATFQMISHGLISSALFLIVGVLYDRKHTREIAEYGGVAHVMPYFATLFMIFSMANVGLPATSGFVGELQTMVGAFEEARWASVGAALGVILSAVYMLRLYRETALGPRNNSRLEGLLPMDRREIFILSVLAVGTLLLGVAPWLVQDMTIQSTESILAIVGRR